MCVCVKETCHLKRLGSQIGSKGLILPIVNSMEFNGTYRLKRIMLV